MFIMRVPSSTSCESIQLSNARAPRDHIVVDGFRLREVRCGWLQLWTFAHPLRNVTHNPVWKALDLQQKGAGLSGMFFALSASGNANRQERRHANHCQSRPQVNGGLTP